MKHMNCMVLITALAIAGWVSCGPKVHKEARLKDRALESVPDDYSPITAILGANPVLDTAGLDDEDDYGDSQVADAPVTHDKDYVGGGDAIFVPTVIANGITIPATYRIVAATAGGREILSNQKSGQEVRVPPGSYDVFFTTKEIAGDPEMALRNVEMVQGRRIRQQVNFPAGEITLVNPGGRCSSSKIQLKEKESDRWLPGTYATCKPIKLMAGEYIAKQGTIEIKGIIVYDGGTRRITIQKQ